MPQEIVASLSPVVTPYSPNATYASSITTQTAVVNVLTSTGYTSTEGVDMLTCRVQNDGLYLVYCTLSLVTASDAATSHVANGVVAYTALNGFTDLVAIVPTGGSVATLDMTGTPTDTANGAYTLCQVRPVSCKQNTDLVLKVKHTVVGTTTTGMYRVGFSIVKT